MGSECKNKVYEIKNQGGRGKRDKYVKDEKTTLKEREVNDSRKGRRSASYQHDRRNVGWRQLRS